MIFRQITHDDLGCASYLVGDEDAGIAAVVAGQGQENKTREHQYQKGKKRGGEEKRKERRYAKLS